MTVARIRQNPEDGNERRYTEGRIGFTIPERVVKSSVKRNRVKRLLREAVRHWWQWIKPGHDMVLSISCEPKIDHAIYAEGIFLQLLLESGILTSRGIKLAEEKLDSIVTMLKIEANNGDAG
jgi:ribonuclease P protein component